MANPLSYTWEALSALLFPWRFMLISLTFLPPTLLSLLRAGDARAIFSWPLLQAAWFGRFWSWAGPQVRLGAEELVVPLLEGRVVVGRVLPASDRSAARVAGVGGTVLEIGPGSGNWVSIFSDRYLPSSSTSATTTAESATPGTRARVTRVYGVEPNPAQHPQLRAKIAEAGLGDVYEIVPVGIEDLASSGRVAPESVDCIVSVLCLCSIPEPRKNIAELYGYLKPGGRWFVYEHVKRPLSEGWAVSLYQGFVNLLWPHLIGGCDLRRDTAKWLNEAGPWSDVDLVHPENTPWYHTVPHTIGILTK
ncbi:S-adenosyl-L-methionine-dependent methyltransferase [Podospora appendiculata]|uniref:S-adenosyl-L-methionine-dependent methyltransferase n=1 Tax=Podospora appendiculata TaxID=314037 RepID=A0AAE0WZQ1_9PEZI|nr:S-adenosyl-L-methionine-dependent methyltransferase [Podospora appendiculata]